MFASAVRAEKNLPDGTSGGNISDGNSKRQVKNRKKQAEKRWKKFSVKRGLSPLPPYNNV